MKRLRVFSFFGPGFLEEGLSVLCKRDQGSSMKDSGSGQLRVQGMVDDSGYAAPKVLIGYRGVPSIGYRRFRVQGLGQSGYLESKVFRVASGSGSSGFGVGDLRVRVCVCVCVCVCGTRGRRALSNLPQNPKYLETLQLLGHGQIRLTLRLCRLPARSLTQHLRKKLTLRCIRVGCRALRFMRFRVRDSVPNVITLQICI